MRASDYVAPMPHREELGRYWFLGIQDDFIVFWPNFQKTSEDTTNTGWLASEFTGVNPDAHQPPKRW
jgi:hypothetical protein